MRNFFSILATHRACLDAFFEKRWLVLPLFSAFFIILSLYPFRVPFLVFIAFIPFFYFVNFSATLSFRKIFWGGAAAGVIIFFTLSYSTVTQFKWIPEAYLFEYIFHILFIPLALIGGFISGFFLLFYRFLRTHNIFFNFFLMGLTVITEIILSWIFGGYYFFTLASTVVDIPFLMRLAGLGGMFLISLAIYFTNAIFVLFLLARTRADVKKVSIITLAFFVILAISSGGILSQKEQNDLGETKPLKIALIQDLDKKEGAFGKTEEDGSFRFEGLETRLREAAAHNPDIIVYPFSPVNGAFVEDASPPVFNKGVLAVRTEVFAQWLEERVPPETLVITWDSVYRNSAFYNEFTYWKDGAIVERYAKRDAFPFFDYTPRWAQNLGLFSTPFDTIAGDNDGIVSLPEGVFGNILCSEVNTQKLAREDARKVSLLFSLGSEAAFADDVASAFTLANARFRAVENGVFVVRGNRFGPSAIISPEGKIITKMSFGEEGVLATTILLRGRVPTPFARYGNTPLYILLAGIIAGGIFSRFLRARKQKRNFRESNYIP